MDYFFPYRDDDPHHTQNLMGSELDPSDIFFPEVATSIVFA